MLMFLYVVYLLGRIAVLRTSMQPIATDRVAQSVHSAVGRSVMIVRSAKTAEPIKMLFGLCSWVGPKNYADPPNPTRRGNFEGESGGPL